MQLGYIVHIYVLLTIMYIVLAYYHIMYTVPLKEYVCVCMYIYICAHGCIFFMCVCIYIYIYIYI